MRKPLELHVYEKHAEADAYRVGGFYSPYALVGADKRLTDAELAAEFHKSTADFMTSTHEHLNKARDWMFRMERFATLPHYDEA